MEESAALGIFWTVWLEPLSMKEICDRGGLSTALQKERDREGAEKREREREKERGEKKRGEAI